MTDLQIYFTLVMLAVVVLAVWLERCSHEANERHRHERHQRNRGEEGNQHHDQ